MLKYMLDTNIAIYIIKNRPDDVREIFNTRSGQACIIEGFSARLEVLPYDDNAAMHTGQIRAELAQRGKPIGPYDQMIAGHARSQGLVLVTNNTKEFKQVPGLRLENWAGKK